MSDNTKLDHGLAAEYICHCDECASRRIRMTKAQRLKAVSDLKAAARFVKRAGLVAHTRHDSLGRVCALGAFETLPPVWECAEDAAPEALVLLAASISPSVVKLTVGAAAPIIAKWSNDIAEDQGPERGAETVAAKMMEVAAKASRTRSH